MTKPYIVKDIYFQKAKEEDLRKRAEEEGLRPDASFGKARLIDLLFKKLVRSSLVEPCFLIAMDLQAMEAIAANVELHQGDMFDPAFLNKIFIQKVEGVVADLAPKTTGIPDADAFHSAELNETVLDFCGDHLKPGGYVITKIFHGAEFDEVVARAKTLFSKVKCAKPAACRDRSRETYIVGVGKH